MMSGMAARIASSGVIISKNISLQTKEQKQTGRQAGGDVALPLWWGWGRRRQLGGRTAGKACALPMRLPPMPVKLHYSFRWA